LSAEPEIIAQAHRLAEVQGTSVSAIFSQMIRFLTRDAGRRAGLGPLTKHASGMIALPRKKSEREFLAEALTEKYDV
jgi:hypothetical protein